MALTEEQLCNLVLETAGRTERELPKFRILGLTMLALETLGKMVAESPRYQAMQKSFAITITGGQTDLDAITGLLFDPFKSLVYPSSSTTPAVYMYGPESLIWGGMVLGASEPIYYSEKGRILQFRNNTDGVLTSLSSTGSVYTNYVPTLADAARPLPFQYQGTLAALIASLAVRTPVPVTPNQIAERITQ